MTYQFTFDTPTIATIDVTADDARQGHDKIVAALTVGVTVDTDTGDGVVVHQLASHPGHGLTLTGVHNPATGHDEPTPDAPDITPLPEGWIEVTHPDGTRYRLRLPTPEQITAHCQDSDRCQFEITAYHQH